jgi:hypothetical protein
MKRSSAFLSCLLLITGCAEEASQEEANFAVRSSRNRDLIPENVILDVFNRGDLPLCVAIAETRVGLGKIDLIPDSGENLENRPPPIMMSGLDISEGLYVIPSEKGRRIFVNIESPGSSSRMLKGVIRAAACRDIFSGNAVKIVERPFSQTL